MRVAGITLKEECESNGLRLNENKTKLMVFERNEDRTELKISVNGKKIVQVNKVVFLEVCSVEMEDTR